jgi:hypothetical protein
MAMRAQFLQFRTNDTANGRIEIFTSLFGRIMRTAATEFVVIEDIGCSPFVEYTVDYTDIIVDDVDVFIQIRINTTEYFLQPDGSQSPGIPGRASPYPRSNNVYPSFKLEPDVYVLPGQNWELILTKDTSTVSDLPEVPDPFPFVSAFVKYTLYDGTDAVLANQLLEMGITVRPKNIDWLKRKLIEQEKGGGY